MHKLTVGVAAACAIVAALVFLPDRVSSADPNADPAHGKIVLTAVAMEHLDRSYTETWYWSLKSIRRKGKPLGYGALACIPVSLENDLRSCTGTLALPQGRLALNGLMLYSTLFNLAVVGGTGIYVGSTGTMEAERFSVRVFQLDVTLR